MGQQALARRLVEGPGPIRGCSEGGRDDGDRAEPEWRTRKMWRIKNSLLRIGEPEGTRNDKEVQDGDATVAPVGPPPASMIERGDPIGPSR